MAVTSQVGSVTFIAMLYSIILVLPMIWLSAAEYADLPCKARTHEGKSVTCICTEDYCDTVIRETPVSGQAMLYTTSKDGERFNKSSVEVVTNGKNGTHDVTLHLNPAKVFQNVTGFGGAITDAMAMSVQNLSSTKMQQHFIDSYCSPKGLEYSMLRVALAGTDFSDHAYGYNELPKNDSALSNFSLTYEDYTYKIPYIKACMEASNHSSVKLLASLWSPPSWMKTNNKYNGFGWLYEEYYETLADYFYKFLKAYEEEGLPFWGTTITNEPLNGIVNAHDPNSLGWTIDQMATFLVDNLGPTLRENFPELLIFAHDDTRYAIPLYYTRLIKKHPKTLQYIDGMAVHWYSDKNISGVIMQKALEKTPGKILLNTEACIIPRLMEEYPIVIVDYGSWTRAEKYVTSMIENLNYNSSGWLDWNMALNTAGGPSWLKHALDAPIIVDAEAGELIKEPLFYVMGHFSKFVPPGAYRIEVTMSSENELMHNVAFITPDGNIVVILYNADVESRSISIRVSDKEVSITLTAKTITTMEFPSS